MITNKVQQGSSLGFCPTFPSLKPHFKLTFESLTLCQVLYDERQRQIFSSSLASFEVVHKLTWFSPCSSRERQTSGRLAGGSYYISCTLGSDLVSDYPEWRGREKNYITCCLDMKVEKRSKVKPEKMQCFEKCPCVKLTKIKKKKLRKIKRIRYLKGGEPFIRLLWIKKMQSELCKHAKKGESWEENGSWIPCHSETWPSTRLLWV